MAQNIGEFLTNRARRDTDLEAIYEPATDNRLSYRELNDRSNQVAHSLKDLGVREISKCVLRNMETRKK